MGCIKSPQRTRGLTERKAPYMCMLLYAWEEMISTVCQYRCVSAFWENEGTLWAVWWGSWEVGEGLVLWTLWHMFSLSPLPTSLNFFHWTINALLPWGVVTEGGMWGYHLLFINTGSGNTPHCQPNPLSLHLVPWQGGWGGVGSGGGGCRDQVQRPRCSANEDDRVFTPLQLWM